MALGLTASLAGGVKAQFGTMAKPMHAGLAAVAGVDAALWAEAGLVASTDGLEARQGYAATHHAARDDSALERLGQRYMLPEVSHKFHACCHGTHAMLEALMSLRDAHGVTLKAVETVEITVHPQYLDICNIPDPRTGLEAKFSYRQLASMMLGGVPTDRLESFTDDICKDSDIAVFRDRVTVRTDGDLSETHAQVVVRTRCGTRLAADHDLASPAPVAEREARLLTKLAALIGEARSRKLWAGIVKPTMASDQSPGEVLLPL